MKFTLHELRSYLDAAAEFERRYQERATPTDNPRKLRDHFLPLAREYTGKDIQAFELDELLPHETIHGSCIAEKDGFSILINRSRNGHDESQVRFVLCKEIFHGILQEDGSNVTDICGHLDEVSVSFPMPDSDPKPSVKSEFLAEIAAMEFLFPYKARVIELQFGKVDFAQISEKYLIPQYYVEVYLDKSFMSELGAMVKA